MKSNKKYTTGNATKTGQMYWSGKLKMLNRTFKCKTQDFSFNYAGHYAEGGPGTIVNVQVSNGNTSFQIRDDSAKKTMEVKKKVFKQNDPQKK